MKKFLFNEKTYTSYDEVETAVNRYVEETFDDFLDGNWDEANVCGLLYRPSIILKNVDPIAYRCFLADYKSYLYEEVEEIKEEDYE